MSQCFFPNGTQYTDKKFTPCNLTAVANNAGHSACCAVGDLCLTNGMCRNPSDDSNSRNDNWYWREGCTDPTFQDDACPRYCMGAYGNLSINHLIFNCEEPDKRKWACISSEVVQHEQPIAIANCDDARYTFTASPPVVYTTAHLAAISTLALSASVTSSTTPSSSDLSTSAPSPDDPISPTSPSSESSSPLRTGLGVGITVGGLVLLALLSPFIVMRTYGRRSRDEVRHSHTTPVEEGRGVQVPAEIATLGDEENGKDGRTHYR